MFRGSAAQQFGFFNTIENYHRQERLETAERQERKVFEGSPECKFRKLLDEAFEKYRSFHLLKNDNGEVVGWIEFHNCFSGVPIALKHKWIAIRSFFIFKQFRNKGFGEMFFQRIIGFGESCCCPFFLVASSFELLDYSDDYQCQINNFVEGFGFRQPFLEEEIRSSSRRLQNWYIDKFGLVRMKAFDSNWENSYLKKKAFLCKKTSCVDGDMLSFIEKNQR